MPELSVMQVFNTDAPNRSTRIINGECSGIVNWNDMKIHSLYKLYRVLIGNHWIPDEIPMANDARQFVLLPEREQNAYLKIIGLLAVLDSLQTLYISDVKAYLTDSHCQAISAIIGQQEVIHNQSYSYVLASIVDSKTQNQVFEYWKHDNVLKKRNDFVRKVYQDFRDNKTPQTFYQSIVSDMVLEGIFFYSGFAFFYNLARDSKMMGTSRMISYIQRDENQHTHFFASIYKQLLADFPELNTESNMQYVKDTFKEGVALEIEWAHHLLEGINGIDLNELSDYIKFTANKRLRQMGLPKLYDNVDNCMQWIRPFSDEAMNDTRTDFFEGTPRNYAKTDGDFDDL